MSASSFIQRQINIQRHYMLGVLIWGGLTLSLGIAITIYWFIVDKETSSKMDDFFKMGPTFLTSLVSGLPFYLFMRCRARIATLEEVKKKYESDDTGWDALLTGVAAAALGETVKWDKPV